jgi:hypothetical protein
MPSASANSRCVKPVKAEPLSSWLCARLYPNDVLLTFGANSPSFIPAEKGGWGRFLGLN